MTTKSNGSDPMPPQDLERKRAAILSADAVAYSRLMVRDEARAAAEELLRVELGFSPVGWKGSHPDIATGLLRHFLYGLRKAGLKE